jgi:hypothetical protein
MTVQCSKKYRRPNSFTLKKFVTRADKLGNTYVTLMYRYRYLTLNDGVNQARMAAHRTDKLDENIEKFLKMTNFLKSLPF